MSFEGYLEQNSTTTITVGPFVDKDDGDTEKIGLTIQDTDVYLSKNGGAKGNPNDTNDCAEDADGIYRKQLDGTDLNTTGLLAVYIHFTDCLYVKQTYVVLDPEAYAGIVTGTAFGTDDKILISTDAQDLNSTFSVNAKAISGSTATADNVESVFLGTGHTDDVDLSARKLKLDSDTDVALEILSSNDSAMKVVSTASGKHGLELVGNVAGHGLVATGGTTGDGIRANGGATSGSGIRAEAATEGDGIHAIGKGTDEHGIYAVGGDTTGSGIKAEAATSGDGILAVGATNGHGLNVDGAGSGEGISATGGATGVGIEATGGATSGAGIKALAQNNNDAGMELVKNGSGVDLDADDLKEITAARMGALTDWIDGGRLDLILDLAATEAKLLAYIQLMTRKDAAIATDNGTELTAINANGGSGGGAFSNQTDAEEAIRDRGDAEWDTATGFAVAGDAMTLAADAIKAVSYDESTAFPVKSDDSAATQIARVGADGDTLESLSDQVDLQATAAKLLAYIQLLARSDAAIETDNGSELTEINANGGSGGGDFSSQTDSEEALRDRGDAAWITGGGGGITDILNIQPLIPNDIDLANAAEVRLALGLTNMLDDLPSTGEITPGTITIDHKAIGGTSWSNVVDAEACSEVAGLIYYDEVFDAGSGYAEGDSLRFTFKGQKIIVSANDYEITDATGWIFQRSIRQTMVGTNNANTTTPDASGTAAGLHSTTDGLIGTAQNDLDKLTGSDGATLATTQANYAPAKAGDAMTLSSGAVTAAVIATDAIDADSIKADAVTKIQSGLATATNVSSAHSTTDALIPTSADNPIKTDTYTLPGQEAPTATPTLEEAIMYLYKQFRNKETQTATEYKLFADNGSTVDQKATVSDDTTTATKGEIGTGA